MTRPTQIARLLVASLDDDHDLERRPAEEVEADLEALGVDPARTVALAKTLARRPGSPAGWLLAGLAADDDGAEIDALETAPLDDVRARVPAGATAVVAAAARRRAGATTDIVPFRRRLRVIGIGGSLVGLAAGLALVILTQRSDVPDYVASAVQSSDAELQAAKEWLGARPAEPEVAAEAPAAPTRAPLEELRSGHSELADRTTSMARARSDEAAEPTGIGSRPDQEVARAAPAPPAFLLVDPAVAPGRWRSLALPDGGLDERLPAARRLAEGRRIVALAAYGTEASRRRVVIVLRRAEDDRGAADGSLGALPDVLGPVPEAFEVLPLD